MKIMAYAPFVAACLVVVINGVSPAAGKTEAGELTLPPHPRLLLDKAGVEQLRVRVAAAPWAAEEWKRLFSSAEAQLGTAVELPPRGGNWSHNYVCPEHSARLKMGKSVGPWQWEHHCPVGPHTLRGDSTKAKLDFDGNGIAGEHHALARKAVDHGLVYQVTGDVRHARRAAEILLAYAERYRKYPMHDNQGRKGKGARVASQSLTEASWLIEIAQGADLVWPALTEQERQKIEKGLLRAALEDVILPAKMGIHNIKCRLNSSIGLVGLLLGDRRLVDLAIDDPQVGYRQQLAKGVMDDGMWTEGSSGYHFFTIEGLWTLAEAARHCGIDLYTERFRTMFDAPLAFARPDLVLPDFNDSGAVDLEGHVGLYELAYARYRQPAYVFLLAQTERRNRMAMLYGVIDLPKGEIAASGGRNSPASGYAILQQGEGKAATWLCLKYGPHGGGHGHFDKNHFILYQGGEILVPDGGTHAYGSPLHNDWDKETFAHNTLVVDQGTQQKAQGGSLAFGRKEGVDFSMTEAGAIYAGVRHVRTVAMVTPMTIVIVDQVTADREHAFDIVHHQIGKWGSLPAGEAWRVPAVAGYKYVTGATVRACDAKGMVLPIHQGKKRQAVLTLAADEGGEVITGYGVLKTTQDRVPVLIQRKRGKTAWFAWAISLDGKPADLRVDRVTGPASGLAPLAEAMLVTVAHAGESRQLLINPEGKVRSAADAGRGGWQVHARVDVRR